MALTNGVIGTNDFGRNNFNVPGTPGVYSAYLVRGQTSQPLGVLQIGPFAFDYEDTNEVELNSEITDHWLENNTIVNDSISIKPVIVTLKGKISELTFSAKQARTISLLLATVESALAQASSYLGKYTPATTDKMINSITQVQGVIVQIEQAAARVSQIAAFLNGPPGRNNQQKAFATLSALQQARVLFTVYTPYQVFNNMAIMSVTATQPKDTRSVSDFTVKMKQLQFVSNVGDPSFFASQFYGNAQFGNQPQTQNGLTAGVQSLAARTGITTVVNSFVRFTNPAVSRL